MTLSKFQLIRENKKLQEENTKLRNLNSALATAYYDLDKANTRLYSRINFLISVIKMQIAFEEDKNK